MMNKIQQHGFSNMKLYLLVAVILLMVMALFSSYVMQQRQKSFVAELRSLQQLQQGQLAQVYFDSKQQVLLAAQLVAADQQLKQLLLSAAQYYRTEDEPEAKNALRQQALPLLSHYWEVLLPFGASQLHLHLAPDAYTFLRAHRPERHSDRLADIRPLVMHSLNSGQDIVGIELGRHGLGLRAVVPLTDPQHKVRGAVEFGVDLQKLVQQMQFKLNPDSSGINKELTQMAMLVTSDLTALLNEDIKKNWYHSNNWITSSAASALHYWLDNDVLSAQLSELKILSFAGRDYLLSLLPMPAWDQNEAGAKIYSVSWQDITNQIVTQNKADKRIMLIWFAASLILLTLGIVLVTYMRRKAQQEVADKQALLKQSEQKLAALYQLSPLPILLNRFHDGLFVEANQALSDLVGYSLEEVKKLSYWDLTPEIYAAAEQEQLKSLTETGRYGPYQKQYRHKAGHLVDIELNGMLFDGLDGEQYIWTIIKDISEHKKLEKLKDDFVSTVSHELRTPLTSISGSLSLVMGGAAGEFSERAEKLLSIAYKNSQRLNLLINDLLDIEKLVAGKVQFEPKKLAVAKLLKEAVEQTQPLAASKNIRLQLQAQPSGYFWADEARLLQVLANFLSNAIKYSPENGSVELSAEHHAAMMRITVKDQGPGIAQSEQFKLFQRFSQLSQAKAGTGLGLAISKEIITLSGGQVGVDSTPGQGASFWFELPLYEDNTSPTLLPHLLVIEDDPDTANLLKAFLEQAHYAVTIVADCQSAWQQLNAQQFAALTLDLKLNQESGADFFLKLRDNPATAELPVLIISAFTDKGKLQLGALSHAVDWLAKPIMPDLLYLKLNRLLATLPRVDRNHRILHIEDDSDIITIMQLQLAELCDYQSVATVKDAQKVLNSEKYDLILLDLGLPDGNGLSLLPMINQSQGEAPVVIFSAQDVSQAKDHNVEAVFSKSRINIELLAKYLKQILDKKWG